MKDDYWKNFVADIINRTINGHGNIFDLSLTLIGLFLILNVFLPNFSINNKSECISRVTEYLQDENFNFTNYLECLPKTTSGYISLLIIILSTLVTLILIQRSFRLYIKRKQEIIDNKNFKEKEKKDGNNHMSQKGYNIDGSFKSFSAKMKVNAEGPWRSGIIIKDQQRHLDIHWYIAEKGKTDDKELWVRTIYRTYKTEDPDKRNPNLFKFNYEKPLHIAVKNLRGRIQIILQQEGKNKSADISDKIVSEDIGENGGSLILRSWTLKGFKRPKIEYSNIIISVTNPLLKILLQNFKKFA